MINLDYNLIRDVKIPSEAQWPNFEEFRLYSNDLRKIDLKPLANCSKFRELDLGDNQLSKIDLEPIMNYQKIESISLERNNLKKIDISNFANKHKNYVLCTDPTVKIKGLSENKNKNRAEIVFSKGVYYSDEQESNLNQFFENEKEEKRIKRKNILSEL